VENPVQQPTNSFKELAAKKKHTAPSWANGEVAGDLYRGIHHQKIANAFFDAQHLSPRDQLLTCVTVAVTSLVTARVARLKVLRADEIERRAFETLCRGLATLELVRDFEARRKATVQAVVAAVVTQTVAMLKGQPMEENQGKHIERAKPSAEDRAYAIVAIIVASGLRELLELKERGLSEGQICAELEAQPAELTPQQVAVLGKVSELSAEECARCRQFIESLRSSGIAA
jgi:hypothetical protein